MSLASFRAPLAAALLLVFTLPSLTAQDAWCEQDGLIVIEVESVAPSGAWVAETSLPGFTGSSYYRWSGPDLFQSPGQGVMTFTLNITNPGDYELRLRNYHDDPDATEENDCWTRMDGGTWVKTYSGPNNTWTYHTRHEYAHDNKDDAHFVLSEGEHVFQISGRSNDFRIDRMHFFLNSVADPTNLNTPESPTVPCVDAHPDENPTSVTASFADGTLAGFETKLGNPTVEPNGSASVQPGRHLAFTDSVRVVLPANSYTDQDTLVRIRKGMPEGSWLGVILRAGDVDDDFASPGGDQTMVYVQRQLGTGRLGVFVFDDTGLLHSGPYFELTEIDSAVSDLSFLVSARDGVVNATLNGLDALAGGYAGIADPVGGGVTSLRANFHPTQPGEIGVDYVLQRAAGDVPELGWDSNGKLWISMMEPQMFSPGVWQPASFVFQHKQVLFGLSPFASVVAPFFDYIAFDGDHFIAGVVDSPLTLPSGSLNRLHYKGQAEGGSQP